MMKRKKVYISYDPGVSPQSKLRWSRLEERISGVI